MVVPGVSPEVAHAGQKGQGKGRERNAGGQLKGGPERGGYAWLRPSITCDIHAKTHL